MHVVIGLDDLVPELDRPRAGPAALPPGHPPVPASRSSRAVDGAVERRTGPLRFGHWEVIESLGESGERRGHRVSRPERQFEDPAAPRCCCASTRPTRFRTRDVRAAERVAICNAYHMLGARAVHDASFPAGTSSPTRTRASTSSCSRTSPPGALLLRLTDPQRALTADAKLRVIRDMLRGLAYAHANGVLHRALSPATVLVTSTGGAMLTGFDYARPEDPPVAESERRQPAPRGARRDLRRAGVPEPPAGDEHRRPTCTRRA